MDTSNQSRISSEPAYPVESEAAMHSLPTRTLMAICALVIGGTLLNPLPAQTDATKTVIVAMFDDYPAFNPQPPAGAPAKAALRAIVIRRDFADEERSVVILNPNHATPEVLYAALVALRSGSMQHVRLTGVTERGTPEGSTLSEPVRSVLGATISRLLASDPTEVRGHRRGRQVVVPAQVQRMVVDASGSSLP